jgi:hypothetical protein
VREYATETKEIELLKQKQNECIVQYMTSLVVRDIWVGGMGGGGGGVVEPRFLAGACQNLINEVWSLDEIIQQPFYNIQQRYAVEILLGTIRLRYAEEILLGTSGL